MSDQGRVILELRDDIAYITFDHVSARNAMTWSMYDQLSSICAQLKDTQGIRAAVLRGAGGKSFVSGTAIDQFTEFKDGQAGVDYEKHVDAHIQALEQLPFPTIAVLEGLAMGGGLLFATACDFRIASAGTKLGCPIARTVSNCLSSDNLARLITEFGTQKVKRMLLLAETPTAEDLSDTGFFYQICPADQLDQVCEQLINTIRALSPTTLKVTKLAMRGAHQSLLPNADDLIRECYGSANFREGVSAFLAKRQAQWRTE